MDSRVEFTDVRVDDETVDAVADVLRGGRYVKGPRVEAFEDAFAAFCGADHAVGVSSGTAALLLAMEAAGVGEGDEVLVPGHTFFATVSPVLALGAVPVFVDVDPTTYTLDPADLARRADAAEDPRAVVPVHLYGQPARMDRIAAVAEEHGMTVVEDACQAHGARDSGRRVGSIGGAGCFSFYPSKNMTVGGDGGMLVTDDPAVARRARELRNHGRDEGGTHVRVGLNYRMDETNAAVGERQLARLPAWNEARRAAAGRYERRLGDLDRVVTPAERDDAEHVYHLYVVQVPDREALEATLADRGIECGVHYGTPAYDHPAVRDSLGDVPTLETTERLCERVLSLPMHPRLDEAEIDRVCEAIATHYGGRR